MLWWWMCTLPKWGNYSMLMLAAVSSELKGIEDSFFIWVSVFLFHFQKVMTTLNSAGWCDIIWASHQRKMAALWIRSIEPQSFHLILNLSTGVAHSETHPHCASLVPFWNWVVDLWNQVFDFFFLKRPPWESFKHKHGWPDVCWALDVHLIKR